MTRTIIKKPDDEARRFKIIRKNAKLTQDEMAELIGKEQSTVNKYEAGMLPIPSDVVKILNTKLQIPYDYFYNGTGPKKTVFEKSSLVKDLGALKNGSEGLEIRIAKLESIVKRLVTDVYAGKHNV